MSSKYDLNTPHSTKPEMSAVIPTLESDGAAKSPRPLLIDEVNGLNENARRVAKKYWETKATRSAQSIRNQLDLPRWHFLGKADYARKVICEMAKDAGMKLAYFSCDA